jgi:signal transduction histidine kinase
MARYALVIGIATYNNFSNLEKAVTDAEAIAQLLERQGNFQEVKRLPAKWLKDEGRWAVTGDKKLTGKELGNALRTFLLEQAAKNEAVIYFAGHGFPVSSCMGVEEGYLATSDCAEDGRNAIPLRHLNALMVESDLSSLVVMLDCCYAGTFLERRLLEPTFTAFNTKRDYYLITACRGFQKAYEGVEHGVFTGAILKGLAAENADEKGQVSGDRLFDFIYRELKGSGQEPIRLCSGRSLTLVQYPPKKTTVVVDETCPYQGLQAFTKEQARFFFGREKVVQLLVEKLGQANFVPIIGASGSGKSSVARAGLIPQLEKNGWRILEPILPGDEPFAELKTVLIELFGRTEGREVYSLVKTEGLRPVIERLSDSERLLLVVDQFEEVFTLCPKEEERRQFIELLTQVAELPDSHLAIVTTMRADFLEPCLSYESLTRLIQNKAVYMPPLLGAELEEAIATPAKLQGYSFGDGLLGAILHDMGQEKECLPLLQFALTELWEKRDREKHLLTVEQYRVLEGVKGALNRHAEKIYTYKDFLKESPQQERSLQEQEWIKQIFLKLVRTAEGIKDTRQRQLKAKLLSMGSDSVGATHASPLLDELIQGRLLVTGQENRQEETWVDLAHEALMESWLQFAQWRQENRELQRLIDRVEDALKKWQEKSQDDSYLLSGGLLSEVRNHYWSLLQSDLSFEAEEYYERSEDYRFEQEYALEQAQHPNIKIQFLLNTTHELSPPLNEIITTLKLIIDGRVDTPEKQAEFLNDAYKSAIHLLGIINDILDIVEIETGRREPEMGAILLLDLLNDVRDFTYNQAQQKKLTFDIKLPEAHDEIIVYGNYQRLLQVLLNLIGNAIKFTHEGGITISVELIKKRVRFKDQKLPGVVKIRVKDTGIGVSLDKQDQLFKPFRQISGDERTRQYGGTGLGLTISQRLVEAMGGVVNFYSLGEGLGSTVTFTILLYQL